MDGDVGALASSDAAIKQNIYFRSLPDPSPRELQNSLVRTDFRGDIEVEGLQNVRANIGREDFLLREGCVS